MARKTVEKPARPGDLCLACRGRTVWYQDRPPETITRWMLYRVHRAGRDGRVQSLREPGNTHPIPVWMVEEPIYVASRDEIDINAALEAFDRDHPDGFESFDEAREFLRRFRR